MACNWRWLFLASPKPDGGKETGVCGCKKGELRFVMQLTFKAKDLPSPQSDLFEVQFCIEKSGARKEAGCSLLGAEHKRKKRGDTSLGTHRAHPTKPPSRHARCLLGGEHLAQPFPTREQRSPAPTRKHN